MTHGNGVRGFEGLQALAVVSAILLLTACGGGSGDGPLAGVTPPAPSSNASPPPPPSSIVTPTNSGFTTGQFSPSASFKNQCASPRSGKSAVTGETFPDQAGSILSENNYLRSWTNELYLWYNEVQDLNPNSYSTADYFDLLKTQEKTGSGAEKDKFHFSMPTEEWESFSQSGTSAGYGATFFILASLPPRKVIVAFTDPNTPAALGGVLRGDEVLTVDGADLVNGNMQADVDKLNAGLSPAASGESHTFSLRSVAGVTRTVVLTSANITSTPVQNVKVLPTAAGNVGYLLFNDHIATAESQLIAAINTLKAQGVVDLVVDMRYNGGGFLDIAAEFAYMIAGSTRTSGQTFERIAFNDKHPSTDPVTGEALKPTPFYATTLGFSTAPNAALPTLDLSRVFILTTADTCSASEAVMNGLLGVDIQVIQIGTTTCGKPYGFYPQDNCGTTYFSVQFKGVNAKGFGDYSDGFSPQNTVTGKSAPVDGCSVADDFANALGSPNEKMLAAALDYRLSSTCPASPAQFDGSGLSKAGSTETTSQGRLLRPEWRKNRMMRTVR